MGADETLKIIAQWQDRGVSRGAQQANEHLERMHRTGGRLDNVFGRLGPTIVGAFSVAAITQIARTGAELAALYARAALTEQTFDRLARREGSTGVAEIEKLRSAVGGTLSDLRLMQTVGAAVDAGLTFEQSRTALEFLRRYSIAFGKNFSQLVSTIFTGLQRGSTLMLDDAGIIIDASSQMFQGLDEVEKKAALVAHAIDLMREKMTVLPKIQSDASTEADKLASSWEKLRIEFGSALEPAVAQTIIELEAVVDAARGIIGGASGRDIEFFFHMGRSLAAGIGAATDATINSYNRLSQLLFDAAFAQNITQPLPAGPLGIPYGQPVSLRPGNTAPGPDRPTIPLSFDFPEDTPEEIAERIGPIEIPLEVFSPEGYVEQVVGDFFGEMRRQAQRQGGLFPMTGEIPFDLRDLFGDGRGGEQQGLPTPSGRGLGDRLRGELGRSVDDLDLFADALSRLHPELGTLVGTVNVGVQSLDLMTSATSLLGKAAGAIGVGGALFSLADSIFGWSRRAQERAMRNAELAREQARTQAELNREIEDAISLTGRFAQSLSGQTDQELRNAFSRNVSILGQYINTAGLTIENILSRENDLRLRLEQKNYDERFDFLKLALNQNIAIAKTYNQRIIDAELELRREQGEIIIDAIERQRRDVLQTLENSLEAQRRATIRAVGLQFDFQEAEIRARYLPRFQITQSQAGREVLLGQVARDIEGLRRGESTALEQALNALIEPNNRRIDETNAFYDGIIQAVRDAIPDTSQPFIDAIREQTAIFRSTFAEGGEVDLLAGLPEDLKEFTLGFLDDIKVEITDLTARTAEVPIDLPTITPSAEEVDITGPVDVGIPVIDVKPEDITEITASVVHIFFPEIPSDKVGDNFTLAAIHMHFPEIPDGKVGDNFTLAAIHLNFPDIASEKIGDNFTLAVIHLNFPELAPGTEGITLSTIHLNFPTLNPTVGDESQEISPYTIALNFPLLNPGIDQISVGGVNVELPHLALEWPPLPRWVWPPLPRLQIDVSGNITTTQRVVQGPPPPGSPTYNPSDFNRPPDPFVDDGDFATEDDEIDHVVRSIGENSGIREAIEEIVRGGG